MRIFSVLRYPEWTMKRKLFGYMLLLAALLLLALMAGLFLFGRFDSAKKNTYESLDIQMEVFEKDISTHFDNLAAAGIRLSEDMTALLEDYINLRNISFDDLTDSEESIANIQEAMIEPLQQSLLREECSGIFVMLNATVNSALEGSVNSRTGLYLQVNGYGAFEQSVLLYRGLAAIGKNHGIMPHRKWRLEFRTDLFPNYNEIIAQAALPLDKAYRLTDLCVLPGTSENAMLLVVPMIGSNGVFYGICGYEVSASYFMTYHAQPTKFSHLTCLLTTGDSNVLDTSSGLSCGVADGYYRVPKGELTFKDAGGGLLCFSGDTIPYIGVTRNISLSPNNGNFLLAIMILKSDYDRVVDRNVLQNVVLWLLLLFFTVNCCLYFSRRFLSPILKDLEQIKSTKCNNTASHIPEINDLFVFLAEKDREHEAALSVLVQEKKNAQSEKDRLQSKYETAQAEISRLAYSRKQEIDPNDYKQFLDGINTLTPTERKIFEHYLSGKSVKEIIAIADIKESTLRYHNHNIYSKLGVNSLKQLLRYAALMRQQGEEGNELP